MEYRHEFMDVLCYNVGRMDRVDEGARTTMQSLQRDRNTKNTCETLILVSGPAQEHVDPDLSDFVVPVQQAVVPGKGERH